MARREIKTALGSRFSVPAGLLYRQLYLALFIVVALAACGAPTAPMAREKLTIAWISKSLGNPVFDLGQHGAMQKAKELSAQGPVDVELLLVGPVSADAVEQARIMDDLIARSVDGIAVSCNDPDACAAPIDRAVAAGIAVMTWDSDSPNSQRFTFLSIDNYSSGRTAADLLAQALGGHGKVAVITGVPGALNLQQRVDGFAGRLAEAYPGIEIVRVFASNEDINLGVQGIEETMQAHPDLRGWFFAGLWPLFADRGSMPLWEEASRNGTVKTVAFDSLPLELDLLRDGYIEALIGQKYWRWGYDSVQMVYDHVVSGKRYPPFIDTGVDIVTRNNVEAMAEAWKTNDFSKALPAP
jgi:ribose transport system substrate-binding protein